MAELTQNDTFIWNQTGWEITPFNFLNIFVAPPELNKNYGLFQEPDSDNSLSYQLIVSGNWRFIDPVTHGVLLERSIVEHGDIWRALAER